MRPGPRHQWVHGCRLSSVRIAFDDLDAPVELVASEDVPMPYNHTLELQVQPTVEKIVAAAKAVLYK
jgi:pyruvate dehydrogenase E1 component beta subunit